MPSAYAGSEPLESSHSVISSVKRQLASTNQPVAAHVLEAFERWLQVQPTSSPAALDPPRPPLSEGPSLLIASPRRDDAPGRKSKPYGACTLCRRCKAKCVVSDPASRRCDRCKATGCVCLFEKHKRGRKRVRGLDLPRVEDDNAGMTLPPSLIDRTDHLATLFSPSLPSTSLLPSTSDTSAPAAFPPDQQPPSALHIEPYDQGGDDVTSEDDEPEAASGPAVAGPSSAAHPLPFISGSSRPFSLQNMLKPTSPSESSVAPGRPQHHQHQHQIRPPERRDPVSTGLISLEMAQQLYSFFFKSLNPIILLFDPHLHTFDYVRSRSTFLFTAMLSSAAKFVAPSISRQLARMVTECSVHAVLGNRRSIEIIQSWMVVYFWKERRDNRAWLYVGLICRTSIEIGLDRTPMDDPLDVSEQDQRERRNRVRTWMLAFMMDRAMSSASGRDWSIRARDPILCNPRHFSNHPLREHGDAVIAGFSELRLIGSRAMDQLSPEPGAERGAAVDIERQLLTINYDLDEWREFWLAETQQYGSAPIYMALLTFFELHIRLTLNSFSVSLRASAPSPTSSQTDTAKCVRAEQHCYQLACDSLSQLSAIFEMDRNVLHHVQDSISIMVAYAAYFLGALIRSPTFDHSQRVSAVMLIAQTAQMFKAVSENPETTAALQAEFLDSLAQHSHALDHHHLHHTEHTDLLAPPHHPASSSSGIHAEYANAWSDSGAMDGFWQAGGDQAMMGGFELGRGAGQVGEGGGGGGGGGDGWIWNGLLMPEPETVDDLGPHPHHRGASNAGPTLLPHNIANADLMTLSDVQWEQIVADWVS